MHRLSRYHVATAPFVDEHGGRSRLLYSTRTGAVLAVSDRTWHDLQEAPDRLPDSDRGSLVEHGLLVDAGRDELGEVLRENRAACGAAPSLYVVVQPTAACQLACGYCGQADSPRQLSDLDVELLVDRVRAKLEARSYASLIVGWFGREPLLAQPTITSISESLIELTGSRSVGYEARVVTNGLALTPSVARHLAERCQVREFEVTLDGPPAVHDVRRPHRGPGHPNAEVILRNLEAFVEQEIPARLRIRCNVDRHNAEAVRPLLALLVERGLHTAVERVYLAPVHDWGNDASREALDRDAFGDLEIEWLCELTALGLEPAYLPERKPVVCMAVQEGSEAVDAYGNLFGCTEIAHVPAYGLGRRGDDDGGGGANRYVLGRLADGLFADHADRAGSFARFNDEIEAGAVPCHDCALLPVCGGSCPKLWREGRTPCPSYKDNLEARLMLHYASLRRSGGPSAT